MEPDVLKWLELARIDIKNQGEGNDVKVSVVEGNGCNIWQAGWFSHGGAGYVMETSDQHLMLGTGVQRGRGFACETAGDR